MTQFVYLDYSIFTLYALGVMGPHPIPQNVTTFQFHLVGDMTLKQFLYLAVGSATAYFLFLFLAPPYPLVAWPLIITSASLGAAFAFLPIASRPLDYWLGAFLKAIYSPTKRIWKKNGQAYKDDPLFQSRLVAFLSSLQPGTTPQPPPPVSPSAASIVAAGMQTNHESTPNLPTTAELGKTVDLARQAQNLQMRIIQTERTLSQIKSEAGQPTSIPVDYSQQVNKILSDLQNLVTQASQIRQQLDSVTKPEQIKTEARVKVIVPSKPKQTQLALTSFPNVINGVVKERNNNYLEGVIAVIYDKEGLPVRALKTNKLGQFTGSTPLPSGTYTLELEKENLTFDVLQIELTGQILPPLMVTAK